MVRDLDVVGVGSLRRQQIQQLQAQNNFILQTHESLIASSVHGIYQAELLNTLQWLRPLRTESGPPLKIDDLLKDSFADIFPHTHTALGFMASRVRDLYLQDMQWSSWLLQDHWRYFVGYLRQKFPEKKDLFELAHWEWVRAWIEVQPFDVGALEPGVVSLNPSLQVVPLTIEQPVLGRDKGLYALVYCDQKATVTERALDVFEAHILDLLQEDRKYSRQQVVQRAQLSEEIGTQLSAQEWEKRYLSLRNDAIILSEKP
ncbi:MAG: hypothetical protein HUU57_07900 [Bdellovibrio sp.]|nr:hypothetical protein [Bdellovibrio sp.]